MGNKTIYVKDEALWDRAKELAGKDGFSALISKALEDFVERRNVANLDFSDHSILIDPSLAELAPDESFAKLIRFKGRSLATTFTGPDPDQADGDAEVYQTRAGRLILVLRQAPTGEAYDRRIYESFDQLAADQEALREVPLRERHEFLDRVAQAMGQHWAEWID